MWNTARLEQLSQEASTSGPNNNSSINNETDAGTTLSEAERNFKIVFYCCLFILGSLGNVLVIVVVKAKCKRTINDYFILNLAVSDLTFLWFSLPFYSYELFQTFEKNLFYCKFIWPMMSVTLSVSTFTLTSMAIERCRGITNPLRPRIKFKATLIWIFLIWICAFVTIFPLMIVAKSDNVSCVEHWPKAYFRQTYTAVLFGLQYVIPLLIIAISYLRIAFCLMTSRLPMRTSMNSRGQVVKHKTRTENIQIIQTLAVIVFLFMGCMLPNQIAWILFDFGGDSHKELSHAFWACAEALIFLHACVNPIVYGTLTRQFRRGYMRYFLYVFCCSKTRLLSTGTLENLTSERQKRSAVVLHGSLKYRSVVEKTRTTHLEIQSSPNLSTSGESNYLGSPGPSPVSSSARRSTSIEMVLRTTSTRQHFVEANTLLNLSFSNNALEVSDDEKSVQDTKL